MTRAAAVVAVALCWPAAASAANAWLRVRSTHFELLTSAGERSGRQLLDRLETVRHVFLESIGGKAPALPVRVYQFASERDFRRFEPRHTATGFHQSAAERDYIAVLGSDAEAQRAVRHEYMHVLLDHGSASLPLWLEEGTAELYSTVELRPAGAVFGSPIPGHVQALGRLEWIEPELFFNARADSPLLLHSMRAGLFYAQAWALAHMLNFSPAWRRHLPQFAESLDRGVPALLGFEPAFGAPPEHALRELRKYLAGSRFATAVIPVPPRAMEDAAPAEPLSESAAGLAQVELMLAVGHGAAADKMLDGIAGPPTVALEIARGLQALARKKTAAARTHFNGAIQLGDPSGAAAFELAMLLRAERGPDQEVRSLLAEAAGRNPDYAEANFVLGLLAQRQNQHREALAAFETALRVQPRQSPFWHAAALSHLQLQQPELARRAALRAAASATTPSQLEMAQAALKLTAAAPAKPGPPPKPAVTVSDAWQPRQGSMSVDGVLEHIDCYGASARFQVRPPAPAAPVRLWVDKPGEVLLKDASSLTFTFACGPQQPRPVTVEYDAEPGLPQSATGRITAIHFRP